ncbi:MAG: DUF45 domain-containing protein [Leptospiraceae bacterium]|nr:DUF45 domain-containing protein [Leptospiraceae bacterium]MCP5494212.1 DUF45 domain-containing protein [Leptospiraceae bacterium]
MSTKKIEISNLGTILLEKRKVKNINIRVSPEGIKVTLPLSESFKSAEEAVFSKLDWIKKHYTNTKQIKQTQNSFLDSDVFSTRNHTVYIKPENIQDVVLKKVKNEYTIYYPSHFDPKDARLQKAILHYLTEIYRQEAKVFLPTRVESLASMFGFTYKRVFIKNMRSRWGSCSSVNNINLNLHLLRLPNELVDYVILHELTHTIHKNHSQKFWKHLISILPNTKVLDKQLSDFSPVRF